MSRRKEAVRILKVGYTPFIEEVEEIGQAWEFRENWIFLPKENGIWWRTVKTDPPSLDSKEERLNVVGSDCFSTEEPENIRERVVREVPDRNLNWGVVCVLAVLPVAGVAVSWAGREAFVALATAVSLGLTIFLMSQGGRLVRERNGFFLLLAVSFLVTFCVPVAVKLFLSGSEFARLVVEISRSQQKSESKTESEGLAVAGANLTPAASPSLNAVQPAPAKVASAQGTPKNAASTVSAPVGSSVQAPEEIVPLVASSPSEKVNPSPVAKSPAPAPSVESRPDEDPIQRATRTSQEEAIRRYPGLAVAGSQEHSMYIEAYNELARLRKFEYFKDPQWPLKIAESLASREGWKRASQHSDLASQSSVSAPSEQFSNIQPQASGAAGIANPKTSGVSSGEEPVLDGPNATVPADPVAQATNRSIIEVRRRYPALGVNGSPENQIYLEAYRELERLRPDFFEKPEWPIHLAEIVAKREGWRRQEAGSATAGNPSSSSSVEPPLPK